MLVSVHAFLCTCDRLIISLKKSILKLHSASVLDKYETTLSKGAIKLFLQECSTAVLLAIICPNGFQYR